MCYGCSQLSVGVFGGGVQAEKIRKLYEDIQKWYSRTKCPSRLQGKLTVERVRAKSGYPKLKSKANQARHLAFYVLEIMVAHSRGDERDRHLVAVCQMLVRYYEVLNSESLYLRPEARDELVQIGFRLASAYSKLASWAFAEGVKMWKTSPKLHLFQHLCEHQSYYWRLNPRYWWCYSDEDLVGQLITVAESLHPRTMAVNTLMKWLHLFFDDSDE